jgi:hypothetical protein
LCAEVGFDQVVKKGVPVIFVYIILFLLVVTAVGKLVTRRSDAAFTRTAKWGSMTSFRFSRFAADPEENPRPVDDGTDYGYKEFD